jgi:hypothetical protein
MSFARRLTTVRWHGAANVEDKVADPSEDQVERAVRALDQDAPTDLYIDGEDWWSMAIAGGGDHFIVFLTNLLSGKRFDLRAKRPESAAIHLITGGQRGRFPPEVAVTLSEALQAARRFVKDGRPDPALAWNEVQENFALPFDLAAKARAFQEDADGRTRVNVRLKDGRVVRDVLLTAHRYVVRQVGSEGIPFSPNEIADVEPAV